jgi:hypothetical protein
MPPPIPKLKAVPVQNPSGAAHGGTGKKVFELSGQPQLAQQFSKVGVAGKGAPSLPPPASSQTLVVMEQSSPVVALTRGGFGNGKGQHHLAKVGGGGAHPTGRKESQHMNMTGEVKAR